MTTINEMTDDKISELFKANGAFFAFGQEQFDKKHTEAKANGFTGEYGQFKIGLHCPLDRDQIVADSLSQIYSEARAEQVKLYGKYRIIAYELHNHEVGYTYDLSDAFEAVKGYGFTLADVSEVFKKEVAKGAYANY